MLEGSRFASRLALLGALAWLGGAAPLPAYATVDTGLGKALYDSRCTSCHERSVHSRKPRSAQSFRQIRAFVSRWNQELGGAWKGDEIDAVTQYLNERYYHFPCPSDVCGLARR